MRFKTQKSNKRLMAKAIIRKQKEKAKERQKNTQPTRSKKKGKKLVPPIVGSYFTNDPFIVTSMQIVRFNSNGRSRISITRQRNLPFYNRN